MFSKVAYLANRAPYAAPGSKTPYYVVYNKNINLALPRVGARAVVDIEAHTTKPDEKVWERRLCRYSVGGNI